MFIRDNIIPLCSTQYISNMTEMYILIRCLQKLLLACLYKSYCYLNFVT